MRAMCIDRFGEADLLHEADLPEPVPADGQVLVRLHHAGVNPVDHKMRDGSSKWVQHLTSADFPLVLGREGAGEVVAVGRGVTNWEPGDHVFGMGSTGCYAELALFEQDAIVPAPDGVDRAVLGGAALAGLTAQSAVVDLGQVTAEDVVLVHGAGGGVGQLVVQLAHLTGAEVWATASGRHAEKLARWGVHHVDYTSEDFTSVCPKPTVVIDGVYFGTYERSISLLSPGDRMVVLPTLADLGPAREAGLEVGIPSAQPRRGRLEELAGLLSDGRLEVEVGQVFPLAQVASAHRLLEAGHAPGKVVLEI